MPVRAAASHEPNSTLSLGPQSAVLLVFSWLHYRAYTLILKNDKPITLFVNRFLYGRRMLSPDNSEDMSVQRRQVASHAFWKNRETQLEESV
jgi:hypothetical protein